MNAAGAAGVVEGSPLCVRCGYDLRGLPALGRCPECAAPVAWALDGKTLRSGGAALVRRLEQGATLAAASVLAELVAVGGAVMLVSTVSSTDAVRTAGGLMLVLAFGALARLVGWWKLTSPDPRWARRAGDSVARQVVRVALALDMFAIGAGAVLVLIAATGLDRTAASGVPLMAALHTVSWLVQFFGSMRYVAWLAVRMPSEPLRAHAAFTTWAVPVLGIGGSIVSLLIGLPAALFFYAGLLLHLRGELRKVLRDLGHAGRGSDGC